MKIKVNRGLLPIKAHFFFFFAALGPLLPQMNVFGRQLGVSPGVMGLVTSVLPLLWAAAKPLFGYVVDYWPNQRKFVFMLLITVMSGSYCCLWFLPMPEQNPTITEQIHRLNDTIILKQINATDSLEKFTCQWSCSMVKFDVYLPNTTYVNTAFVDGAVNNISCSLFHMDFSGFRGGEVTCAPKANCDLYCFDNELNVTLNESTNLTDLKAIDKDNYDFYKSATFWGFVVLMCVGTVAFNVANCISDAVCFDVLGQERASKYGNQRAWGTIGYGVTALLGGWLVDLVSRNDAQKDFTPAFLLAIIATTVDLYSCRALKLPSLSSPDDAGKALRDVLKMPKVLVFILFAVIAGTFDSFIIYYMFWFLEELAEKTDSTGQIKLIEGVVVAAQSFIGELLFFFLSGKIIKRWGYGATLTLALFGYGVRMALVSFIQHPWHLVYIEAVMQGPTYALCYSCIVGYAAAVAPPGYSATVQGLVAGMDDGVGFAFGSLIGGQLYSRAGGRESFRIMACVAAVASLLHLVMYKYVAYKDAANAAKEEEPSPEGEKILEDCNNGHVVYKAVPLYETNENG